MKGAGVTRNKLDGVGPVNNRPSTDLIHHVVRKKKKEVKKRVTLDKSHLTRDM